MEPILWFGWFRADIIAEYGVMFWRGLQMTILVTLICIAQGTTLGLAIGLARLAEARHSPAKQICRYLLRWPSTVYVSFFRGTPLFVQILLIHFALMPALIHPSDGLLLSGDAAREIRQNYGAFLSGLVALTLNAGAYITEIFRAGIQSIDRGQTEAARSLGMSFSRILAKIVIPQALRSSVLPMTNLFIAVMLTTALGSQVPLKPQELTGVVSYINTRSLGGVAAFFISALGYLGTAFVVSHIGNYIDKKVRILR